MVARTTLNKKMGCQLAFKRRIWKKVYQMAIHSILLQMVFKNPLFSPKQAIAFDTDKLRVSLKLQLKWHTIYAAHVHHCLFCLRGSCFAPRGPVSIWRPTFPGMGIPMLKMRRSGDRLIFNMGIHIPVRRNLYIETGLRFLLPGSSCPNRPSVRQSHPGTTQRKKYGMFRQTNPEANSC